MTGEAQPQALDGSDLHLRMGTMTKIGPPSMVSRRVRDWLAAFRIHTASLTIPGMLLGVVAAGDASPVQYVVLAALAFFFHGFGFLHNNLMDIPYDRLDPHKSHMPLVAGRIDKRTAWNVWVVGTIVTAVAGTQAAKVWTGSPRAMELAILFWLGAVSFGFLYNMTSKRSFLAPLWISTSFACLPVYAYFAVGGDLGQPEPVYLFAYAWILMLGQIAVSGYVKELAVETEVNLLRELGARASAFLEDGYAYRFSARVLSFAWSVRVPLWVMGIAWGLIHGGTVAWALVLSFAAFFAWLALLVDRSCPRSQKILWMALSEIIVYWLLVWSLAYLMPAWAVWAFVLGPLVYYIAANRMLWGRAIAPAV